MSIVCDTGFINIVDPFLNPDSTVWTGSITYTLQYATTVAGATLVEARQVINVSDGIDICLAPGLYTVVYNQSGQRLPVTSQWTVPPTGGPYTIADLEGVGPVTGSLTVTGPFIAMSTVTMTSLINAAARPYVATDAVGLLSTGNLALIAISGSASDFASGTVAAARGGAGTLTGLLKANGAGVVSAAVAGTDYAVATNGTNAQFLTSNGAGGFGTAVSSTGSGSVVLATSPTLTTPDLGTPSVLVLTNATGLPAAAMPGLTGDVTSSAGSVATTVVKINGTTLSGLATGLLKNTTATGVPSIAVAGTDYAVATNGTNGQALTSNGTGGFGTAVTLATVATSGSASDLTSGTLAAARGGAGTLTGILKANGAGVVSAATAGTDYAVATNGTIGQALTSNGTGGFSTALTLATVATSGSASDLGSGTLPAARLPALTGDATSSVGSAATTVVKINGTALSGLATGLLKNTTTTGVPSIAIAGTDYAIATNGTIGQALTSNGTGGFSTALTLATVATSGSASDLTAGTLAAARMPAITGDVTTTVGTVAATVVKINGTTLSSLATGLLKNTTATGVPSIAVAGTDLIGGVGNLTTVGAVPYVSATGMLNQDPADFFWDATNNRLGIGTATPVSKLDITDTSNANLPIVSIRNTNGYAPQLNFDTYGYSGTPAAMFSVLNLRADYAGAAGAYLSFNVKLQPQSTAVTAMTILGGGNVGIGTTTPVYLLDVAKSGASGTARFYDQTATTGVTYVAVQAGANQLTTDIFKVVNNGNVGLFTIGSGGEISNWIPGQYTKANEIGYLSGNATNAGIRAKTLLAGTLTDAFQVANTGNFSIGSGILTNNYKFDVQNSGSSGTARFYDQTATTGSTLASFRAGIAQSTNPVLTVNNNANTVVFSVNSTGNVGIGATTPGQALDVLGSARVYNSAADAAILFGSDQVDANSGKISYNRGTANLDITPRSTYATNLIGKLKFSITNSTGANSALLGSNCPAVTFTAPYTWITVTTSDGSTGYMPIWK